MYQLKDSDEGDCPKCRIPLTLLQRKTLPDGYPAFLICFGCRDVTEVSGDDGQTVEYKRGRRKKFPRHPKRDKPDAKKQRLRDHQAKERDP